MKAKKRNYSRIFRKYLPVCLFIGTLFALIFVHYQYSPASRVRQVPPSTDSDKLTLADLHLKYPGSNTRVDPPPTPQLLPRQVTFPLGGFKITVPANTAYPPYGSESIKAEKSERGVGCDRVGNMYRAWYSVKTPGRDSMSSNTYGWTSWSPDQLEFSDDNSRNYYLNRIENLEKLFRAPDGNLEISPEFSFDVFRLSLCGGYWFYSVYKQEIHNTGFDRVLYVEVNSGNGDPFGSPVKYVVVSHNGNWLMAGFYPIVDTESVMFDDLRNCMNRQTGDATLESGVECTAMVWGKYRNQEEIDAWVNQVLSQID